MQSILLLSKNISYNLSGEKKLKRVTKKAGNTSSRGNKRGNPRSSGNKRGNAISSGNKKKNQFVVRRDEAKATCRIKRTLKIGHDLTDSVISFFYHIFYCFDKNLHLNDSNSANGQVFL